MATLASTGSNIPGQAAPSTVAPNINFGDPNSVQQLLSSPSSNSGDLAAHVDEKQEKPSSRVSMLILYCFYTNILLPHPTLTNSSPLLLMANPYPSLFRARGDLFFRSIAVGFLRFFYCTFICLSTPGGRNVRVPQHYPDRAQKVLRSLLACI